MKNVGVDGMTFFISRLACLRFCCVEIQSNESNILRLKLIPVFAVTSLFRNVANFLAVLPALLDSLHVIYFVSWTTSPEN